MALAQVLGINRNVIQIYNDENIELLSQNLVNITLEAGWCIGKTKKYDLVLEMAVLGAESRFPFIALLNPHPVVSTGQIQLSKTSGLT